MTAAGPNLPAKTDGELDAIIANHERLGQWSAPLLLAAVAERSRRRDGGLDLDRTLALILSAAREGRFVTYKDVAAQSGLTWDKVRWRVFDHLGDLCVRERARSGTMPSVMVVPEPNREDGTLSGESYAGFERIHLRLHPSETLRGEALVARERQKLREFAAGAGA